MVLDNVHISHKIESFIGERQMILIHVCHSVIDAIFPKYSSAIRREFSVVNSR